MVVKLWGGVAHVKNTDTVQRGAELFLIDRISGELRHLQLKHNGAFSNRLDGDGASKSKSETAHFGELFEEILLIRVPIHHPRLEVQVQANPVVNLLACRFRYSLYPSRFI